MSTAKISLRKEYFFAYALQEQHDLATRLYAGPLDKKHMNIACTQKIW